MIIQHDIYTEHNYGLYEHPAVESLDPLTNPFRYNPFNDSFWNFSDDEQSDNFHTG